MPSCIGMSEIVYSGKAGRRGLRPIEPFVPAGLGCIILPNGKIKLHPRLTPQTVFLYSGTNVCFHPPSSSSENPPAFFFLDLPCPF